MPWRADTDPGSYDGPSSAACERVRDRIDPYLDEDLAPAQTRELEAHLADCPDCRTELGSARRLRVAMREGLPMLSCPPEVSAEVLRIAREEAGPTLPLRRRFPRPLRGPGPARDTRGPRFLDRLRTFFGAGALRPALAVAAVLLLLVAAPFLYRSVVGPEPGPQGPEMVTTGDEPTYSPEEIARAEEEARLVLAYVASVGRDAGRAVQQEVFTLGLGRPTRRVMESLEAAGVGGSARGPGAGDGRER